MKVLIACESSGVVRRAFRASWHDAWSCDLLPADDGGEHLQMDALRAISEYGPWDLLIAHPPCTYLCSSGLHWNKRRKGRADQTERALVFVSDLMRAPVPRIAIENPQGCISTRIRPADQYIQPYEFGENASKKTGLWLKNLPNLIGTSRVKGRMVGTRERWDNQTDSGQNKLCPSEERWKERSKTYEGIAAAMAEQWGSWLPQVIAA